MVDTLRWRLNKGQSLTPEEVESALEVFGKRCQERTKRQLRLNLTHLGGLSNHRIFGRVHIEDGRVSYCAGQSYPDEIRLVRDLILGRKG